MAETIDLDALLELKEKQRTSHTTQQQRQSSNQVKIQKVQPYLRQRTEFAQYYFPKLVSIGPIHHRLRDDKNENLKLEAKRNDLHLLESILSEIKTLKDNKKMNLEQGEEYKKMWALKYLNDKGDKQNASQLLESIQSEIKTLKGHYTEDVIQGLDDDELAWILFVDGCAVLHFINEVNQKLKLEALDIVVLHDLLLLENQLPYQVLMKLSSDDEDNLRKYIQSFLKWHHMIIADHKKKDDEPTHLLDLLRTTILSDGAGICSKNIQGDANDNLLPTHRNIEELMLSGIEIKPNDPTKSLTSIDFRHHRIYLSKLTVDDFTAQTFLNMIAYEMCPDFKSNYEISTYMSFLNSLIDNAEDVKELRKAGVLHNFLGSDEEVAKMFNTVSTDMVLDTGIYDPVKQKIEAHYRRKWMTWFTEFRRKHFHSPWAIIGLIATILGIILTVLNLIKAFR